MPPVKRRARGCVSRLPSTFRRLFGLSGSVRRGIRLSYWASGLYNAFAIALALQGLVTPLIAAILMPLSSVSLCLIAYTALNKD
jgi:cation transport ATPase